MKEAKENAITLLAVGELGNFLPTCKKRFKQSLTPDSGQTLVDNNMPKTWIFKSAAQTVMMADAKVTHNTCVHIIP